MKSSLNSLSTCLNVIDTRRWTECDRDEIPARADSESVTTPAVHQHASVEVRADVSAALGKDQEDRK